MPEYRYRAVDEKGGEVSGTMNEDSAVRVTAILHEQGLQVTTVEPVLRETGFPRLKTSLSWEDIDLLNRQLLAITRSGLPLAPSLKALASEVYGPRLKSVLEELRVSLEAGRSLEEAMSAQGVRFPAVYRAALTAGERTGNLPGVLEQLCSYSGYMVETKTRMQEAAIYPLMVIVVCLGVLGFLLAYVVPEFAEIFKDFGAALPLPTRFWVDVSMWLRFHYPGLLMFIAILVLAVHFARRFLMTSEPGRYGIDWVKLHLPLAGRALRQNSLARFSHTLGLLLGAQAPLLESIRLAAAASGNAVLDRAATEAARNVEKGASISGSFEATGFFDGTFTWLIGLAEQRGDMDAALLQLAATYEQGGRRVSQTLVMLVPPAVLALLGCIVASIIVSIYLPIFTLADAVSGS